MKKAGMELKNIRGFTLVEVIVVLIILGIVAAVATVTLFSTDTYATKSQVAMVKAHLRYAQARSIHSGSSWGINFAAGTKSYDGREYSNYWLFTGSNAAAAISFQVEDDSKYMVVFSDGSIGIWPLSIGEETVTFDKWGSPGLTNITISTDGGDIVVTKNTGYID